MLYFIKNYLGWRGGFAESRVFWMGRRSREQLRGSRQEVTSARRGSAAATSSAGVKGGSGARRTDQIWSYMWGLGVGRERGRNSSRIFESLRLEQWTLKKREIMKGGGEIEEIAKMFQSSWMREAHNMLSMKQLKSCWGIRKAFGGRDVHLRIICLEVTLEAVSAVEITTEQDMM